MRQLVSIAESKQDEHTSLKIVPGTRDMSSPVCHNLTRVSREGLLVWEMLTCGLMATQMAIGRVRLVAYGAAVLAGNGRCAWGRHVLRVRSRLGFTVWVLFRCSDRK
jgi:hypothetical protein